MERRAELRVRASLRCDNSDVQEQTALLDDTATTRASILGMHLAFNKYSDDQMAFNWPYLQSFDSNQEIKTKVFSKLMPVTPPSKVAGLENSNSFRNLSSINSNHVQSFHSPNVNPRTYNRFDRISISKVLGNSSKLQDALLSGFEAEDKVSDLLLDRLLEDVNLEVLAIESQTQKLKVVPVSKFELILAEIKARGIPIIKGPKPPPGWLSFTAADLSVYVRGSSTRIGGDHIGGNQTDAQPGHVDHTQDWETRVEFEQRLILWIEQMMFVSGETAEPSPETTWMIEEIVREQVLEMLKEASALANRRGSKSISIVDLIFQIRHNTAKVSRLKTFLSWKDVRKNVKDSDDKGGADADALDIEDSANLPGANPAAPQKSSANKKAKLILPWEVQSFYSEAVPEREDEEDEEEEEQNDATIARLAAADERTKNMTRDEYVYWSDCRQASFTFRKGKRFREWAGFGTIIDSKPNDDVVDILGFLTFEIVQTITEEALKVKAAEDLANKKANGGRGDAEASKKRKREGCTLFEMPEEGRTPVEPKHVREAFRRLQSIPNKYKFMRHGYAGMRTPLRMI